MNWLNRMLQIVKTYSVTGLVVLAFHKPATAQDVDEVVLNFAYPAVGQTYITANFRGDVPLIGVGELLQMLFIPYKPNGNQLGYAGAYPNEKDYWEIDPGILKYRVKGVTKSLNAEQIYKGQADLFVSPEILEEIFGFKIVVNLYGLNLSLTSERPLPVDERNKRRQIRSLLKQQSPDNVLLSYPLLYPRNRKMFALGMFDYIINANQTLSGREGSYFINAGIELLGGDFQMGVAGLSRSGVSTNLITPWRWRYVFKGGLDGLGNHPITELNIGRITTTSPEAIRLRGASITNTPLLPRRVLDVFAIEGFTDPDSEVELLIAGQLVDFTRADELGYYRFNTPLTYGTIRIGIRIYTPSGEVRFEDRQLQIPFTFLPRGVFNYNAQLGFREFPADSVATSLSGNGDVSFGLTNSITLRVGSSYAVDSLSPGQKLYGGANFRVFDQYLFNVEGQQNRFIRTSGSVFYANNSTINFQHTRFVGRTELNSRGERNALNVQYFQPFNLGGQVIGLRFGMERLGFNDRSVYNYQSDVNFRVGQIIARLNYRQQIESLTESPQRSNRQVTGAFTYMVPRTPGVPVLVRGLFLRTQVSHDMQRFNATALGSFQFSQTLFKNGRLTIGIDRDLLYKTNTLQVGFLYDFSMVRSATRFRAQRDAGDFFTYNVSQNFSGSFAVDPMNKRIVGDNRDQVGRAGVSIRLFIDENGNEKFDKGEEIVSAKAVRLDQSSNTRIGRDGILRISQLQSYWTYRMTVDVNQLPDATLSPVLAKLSFVADPNQYKHIDIPLYRTGTIEGMMYKEIGPNRFDIQPGVRMYAYREGESEPLPVIRSLSDGSFYASGLVPGNYFMLVDSVQLRFMKVVQSPDTLKFTIRATAEGDWVDTLRIVLKPRPVDSTSQDEPLTLVQLEAILAQKLRTAVQAFSEAQELLYRGRFEQAMTMTDSSLGEYTTDFAIAMKGSIAYMQGDKQAANNLWAAASERNPFISLPDTNKIRLKVSTFLPDSLALVPAPKGPADTIAPLSDALLAELEAGLGEQLRNSVTFFTEAQEKFYRLNFMEALSSVDSSLNYFESDHALALKGSIVYIMGRKNEAWQYWYQAQDRNPMIQLPDINLLDRLTTPIAEAPDRNARKRLISN